MKKETSILNISPLYNIQGTGDLSKFQDGSHTTARKILKFENRHTPGRRSSIQTTLLASVCRV